MGTLETGSCMGDVRDLTSSSCGGGARTVVLVGRTGNGKSATGNSILGRGEFTSRSSSSGVTSVSQIHEAVLGSGQIINVIDTPGLFDCAEDSEFVGEGIVECTKLAKDGIDALLVVFSVRLRFSEEEGATVRTLKMIFGEKIVNYMIIVFTGGDDLRENGQTLEEYLGTGCPSPLKEILRVCGDRCVLFDNKTKDEREKRVQVQSLLSLVSSVVSNNNGQPFRDELSVVLKRLEKEEKIGQSVDGDLLKRAVGIVESRMNVTFEGVQKKIKKEKSARLKLEKDTRASQERSTRQIHSLKNEVIHQNDHNRVINNPPCAIL